METDTYLLYGNINRNDVIKAKELLKTNDVYEVRMKSLDPNLSDNLAVVVYIRFNIIDYKTGLSLLSILSTEAEKLFRVAGYFTGTGRTNDYISIDLFISYFEKLYSLLIVSETKTYELTLTLLDNQLEKISNAATAGDCIKAMIDHDNNLEISNCNHLKDLYAVVKDSVE